MAPRVAAAVILLVALVVAVFAIGPRAPGPAPETPPPAAPAAPLASRGSNGSPSPIWPAGMPMTSRRRWAPSRSRAGSSCAGRPMPCSTTAAGSARSAIGAICAAPRSICRWMMPGPRAASSSAISTPGG
ncbi:hypothetical protein ACFQ4K_14050 [Tistrella bauzanensis]